MDDLVITHTTSTPTSEYASFLGIHLRGELFQMLIAKMNPSNSSPEYNMNAKQSLSQEVNYENSIKHAYQHVC